MPKDAAKREQSSDYCCATIVILCGRNTPQQDIEKMMKLFEDEFGCEFLYSIDEMLDRDWDHVENYFEIHDYDFDGKKDEKRIEKIIETNELFSWGKDDMSFNCESCLQSI